MSGLTPLPFGSPPPNTLPVAQRSTGNVRPTEQRPHEVAQPSNDGQRRFGAADTSTVGANASHPGAPAETNTKRTTCPLPIVFPSDWNRPSVTSVQREQENVAFHKTEHDRFHHFPTATGASQSLLLVPPPPNGPTWSMSETNQRPNYTPKVLGPPTPFRQETPGVFVATSHDPNFLAASQSQAPPQAMNQTRPSGMTPFPSASFPTNTTLGRPDPEAVPPPPPLRYQTSYQGPLISQPLIETPSLPMLQPSGAPKSENKPSFTPGVKCDLKADWLPSPAVEDTVALGLNDPGAAFAHEYFTFDPSLVVGVESQVPPVHGVRPIANGSTAPPSVHKNPVPSGKDMQLLAGQKRLPLQEKQTNVQKAKKAHTETTTQPKKQQLQRAAKMKAKKQLPAKKRSNAPVRATTESDELNRTETKNLPCSCTKSRCIKLYCVCFQKGLMCDASMCECKSCLNTNEHAGPSGERTKAASSILFRRPDAFEERTKKTGEGCACKKSR